MVATGSWAFYATRARFSAVVRRRFPRWRARFRNSRSQVNVVKSSVASLG
jgi:hypothetical protein